MHIATKNFARSLAAAQAWEDRLERNARRLILREAHILRRDIIVGIRTQAPGGDRFQPLAPGTIAAKGSSKALIDKGDLIRSVNVSELEGWKVIFVGVNRSEQNQEGDALEDIAELHEFGTGPSSGTRIPPRPFLRPSFREWAKVGPKRFADALAKSMGLK